MSDPVTLADWAVWYAENGFGVIPLLPRSKKPATKHGLNDWTDNPEDVRLIWERNPNYNIGIVTGTASHGLLVLDFDEDDEKGVHGFDTRDEWETLHGELPCSVVALTGRGGEHYLYRTDRTNIRPLANPEKGVDVRCEGSYIVAPPSIHPNGQPYAWEEGRSPLNRAVDSATAATYDFLDHIQRNGGVDEDKQRQPERFELPEVIRAGERNDVLFRYGCSLRSRGLPDDAINSMMRTANAERCTTPLTEGEMRQLIGQVCKFGPGHDGEGTYAGETIEGIGRPGGTSSGGGGFRVKNKIQPNLLARLIIEQDHACHIDGAPAVWTGRRWEMGRQAFERITLQHADDATTQCRNEVFTYIQAMAPQVTSNNGFDGGYYVQFADGVTYDVMRGEVVEPNPSMFIIGSLSVDYDPDAAPGPADDFLRSLAGGDEVIETVLCEIIGACMCSRRAVSQALFLIGRAGSGPEGAASNGKSTFINVLRALLGVDNFASMDVATMGQQFQAGSLVGKLANLGDDIPDGFLQSEQLAVFKKVVTGDTLHTDVKYGRPFEFRPAATMVFSMNAMPRLADTTDGVYRRLKFVSFMQRFAPGMPGYDPHMEEKMTRPENLRRLAIRGLMVLRALIERGQFTIIPAMEAELEQVRIDNDIVRRWLFEQNVTAEDLDGQWTDQAYADFRTWADAAGERYAVTQSNFTKKVLVQVATLRIVNTRERGANKRGRKFRIVENVLESEGEDVENY